MSNEENYVRAYNGIVQVQGGVGGKTSGLLAIYTNSTRPDASSLPDGTAIFNSETSKINVAYNGSWVEA